MTNNAYELFKKMYLCLDSIWDKNQEEDLRLYLSDADPLFYENGTSLDPVVFEDFKKIFNEKQREQITDYDFVLCYLSQLDSYYGDIKKYFLTISKEEFNK